MKKAGLQTGWYGTTLDGCPLKYSVVEKGFEPEKLLKFKDESVYINIQFYERLINIVFPIIENSTGKLPRGYVSVIDVKYLQATKVIFQSMKQSEVKQRVKLIKENYQHNGHTVYVINIGVGFRAIWSVVSFFLPKELKSKVVLLGDNYLPTLLQVISP